MSSSSGSPTFSAFMPATNRSANASYTSVWTMNRLAAIQDCPLFCTLAVTATWAARSMSAEGITTYGSLPPSSSTVFLTSSPAVDGDRPSRGLAAGEGGRLDAVVAQDLVDRAGADQQGLEGALGEPARWNRSSR